jgi:peptidoglycan/LPS O-acetylase OafA/YrhL
MRRIPSLDGLRAISIALVVLSHLTRWGHTKLDGAGTYGDLGVRVFFVLSGFLITGLLLKEYERTSTISLKDFYVRRAFRIFPAAFVYLAVVVPVFHHEMTWYHVLAAVFYVSNMDLSRPWPFGHLWSLSIEEQFYLLWPFAVKKWYRHRKAILISVFCFTPVFRTALYAFKIHNGLIASLPVHADELAIGCLLAVFAPRLPRIRGFVALPMLVYVLLSPWFPAYNPVLTLLMLFAVRPLAHISIALLVLHVIQVPYRALNWAPVVWLGKISYSVYLWQELFCTNSSLRFGYSLLLPTLAAACLSYYLVEQPMLRLRERWSADEPVPSRAVEASMAHD